MPKKSSKRAEEIDLAGQALSHWQQRIAPMLGFKRFRNAAITIAGIELLHRIRKGQFARGRLGMQGRAGPALPIVR